MVQGSISSVVLPKPLAPVRGLYERSHPTYNSKNLVIYRDGILTAASISQEDKLDLILEATFTDCPQGGLTLTVESTQPSSTLRLQGSSTFNLPEDGSGKVAIPITLVQPEAEFQDLGTPWCLHGSLKWGVQATPNEKVTIGETLIELYVLTPTLFNNFLSAGIPRELLVLMVRPTLLRGIRTERDWIKWVVHKCFNSQPENGSINDEGDITQPIHSYRYDVYTTSTSFSTSYGSNFALDKWLSHRSGTDPWGTINCYDQAGLVIVSLSLGVPFERIRWQHLKRFGYLPSQGVPLVGWGLVNTTRGWGADRTKKILGQDDSNRKAFSNHSFASVEINREDMALDACAGPVVGDVTLTDYVKNSIDHKTKLDNNPQNEHRPGTVHDLAKPEGHEGDLRYGLPMQADFHINLDPHNGWDTQKWAGGYWELVGGKDEAFQKKLDELWKFSDVQPPASSVNIWRLFAVLSQDASERFPQEGAGKPDVELTEDKPKPGQTHFSMDPHGATAQWTYNGVRVIIRVLTSLEDARTAYTARILTSADPFGQYKAPSDEEQKGCCHTVGKTEGSHELFYYGRIVIDVFRVSREPTSLKVGWVADNINRFIHPGGDPKCISAGSLQAPQVVSRPPGPIKLHDDFEIKVKAEGAYRVKANDSTEGVSILKSQTKDDDNTWTFKFNAAQRSKDEIVFTSFQKETFETKNTTEKLEIRDA